MPPKTKLSREDVVSAALALVEEGGENALSARAVAGKLGVSTQPIFTHFPTMEDLKKAVILAAADTYHARLKAEMESGKYPPYKASGMGYIAFAGEHPGLFHLLFMRDRKQELPDPDGDFTDGLLPVIEKSTSLDADAAKSFHFPMWVFVHGIATMSATGYLHLDENTISELLSAEYLAMKAHFEEKRSRNETEKR